MITDSGLLLSAHRFLRDAQEDASLLSAGGDSAHACRLAQRYDTHLNKNYALCSLDRLPQLGLRWRTLAEVRSGKGETHCGTLGCMSVEGLRVFEVPFAYRDSGSPAEKLALVKLLCCSQCSHRAFPSQAQ